MPCCCCEYVAIRLGQDTVYVVQGDTGIICSMACLTFAYGHIFGNKQHWHD